MKSRLGFAIMLLALSSLVAGAQEQNAGCPMHAQHQKAQAKAAAKPEEHPAMRHEEMAGMNARGDTAMGFSQGKTTHRFRLFDDGGAIEVEANDSQDEASRASIRQHLAHIAQAFSQGDFSLPMFIHEQVPPGVPVMKRLQSEIKYEVENTERGARVSIKTQNPEALAAVQDFLRFQIKEHHTEQ
ncbi:MAG: hypothetical protein QOF02_256 [Blastocatellia bacterium]|jgi:hypothetical protein|nr:hypothetical protein [Blastocatellia bacterium]